MINRQRRKKIKVDFNFVDDKKIRELNRSYFRSKMATDVIAFNINENLPDGSYFLGEVIVSWDKVKKQAKKYKVSEKEELARVITHGILHLLGYDDSTEEKRKKMEKIQEKLVK